MKNELRIGNYINNYNKVLSITDDGLLCTGLSIIGVVIIENPKPIPLTEEILLKCGFEKKNYGGDYYYFNGVCLDLDFQPFLINNHSDMWDSYGFEIKYLHQLQNLYFSLTNEELTVNL